MRLMHEESRNQLRALAVQFEDLSKAEMPDPTKPTPIYVSRSHFAEWAEEIREAIGDETAEPEVINYAE